MSIESPSFFSRPAPRIPVRKGVPAIVRPTREEITKFPSEARVLLDETFKTQEILLESGDYDLKWVEGKHFLLVGGTGPGLGGAIAPAVLNLLGDRGSLTVISRDLSRSLGFSHGAELKARAEDAGFGTRFNWMNDGQALDGEGFEKILFSLKAAGADRVVYINTVAMASSGIIPGFPPVFVKDMDEEGLFQWELPVLDERSINATKHVMGTMAVDFTDSLENAGVGVVASAFADWRGSLDRLSRDPSSKDYGRCGAYSTSLYLPKDIIQEATAVAYGKGKPMLDLFFPVMRTRALNFIPGGRTLSYLFDRLMQMEGIRRVDIPELALNMLERIGKAIHGQDDCPFPRLDAHEMSLDMWFFEVYKHLNSDEDSKFFYKRWLGEGIA